MVDGYEGSESQVVEMVFFFKLGSGEQSQIEPREC